MTAKTEIALVGAGGRMGLEIARAASDRPDVGVVSAVERPDSPVVGRDLGDLAGIGHTGVIVARDMETAFLAADVVVDLSLPEATGAVVKAARAVGKPLVCGTTGLQDQVAVLLDRAADDIPVLYTTNLSPGVAVMGALLEQAARALGDGYDVEIVEMHHRDKVDAPSGTALTLAGAAARGRGLVLAEVLRTGRAGHTGVRPNDEIGVHAVRGGGVFGDHTCVLASRHERLEITHRAASRALFADGALRAAIFLAAQEPGRYTMAEVFAL